MLVSADWFQGNPSVDVRGPLSSYFDLFAAVYVSCFAIMVDVMDLPKSRVNASMLAQFIDRPVCFVGKLEKVRVLNTPVPRSIVGERETP